MAAILVFLLLARAGTTAEPTGPAFEVEAANAIMAAAADDDHPAVAAAVVRPGGVVWEAYRGKANLDYGIPAGPSSRFYLGSLAKPFVAATTLRLAADGLIDLDAPITRYLPDLPHWGNDIRVRHLLQMTSGIRDYLKLRDFAGAPKYGPFDNDSALEQLRRQQGLVFAPGAKYQYSNSNFVLLWEILRRTSREGVSDLIDGTVFDPLGMSAMFEEDFTTVVPGRVVSYRRDDVGRWHRMLKTFSSAGDGGAWGSLPDLIAWDAAVRKPPERLREPLAAMATPHSLPDGGTAPYGAGLLVRKWRGLPVLEHGGSMLGFQHHWMYFPEQQTSVIAMTSNAEMDFLALRDRLVELALGESAPPPPAASRGTQESTPVEVAPDHQPLQGTLGGCFRNPEIPLTMALDVASGTLFVHPSSFRRIPTRRESAHEFTALGGQLRLTLDVRPDGSMPGFKLAHPDLGTMVFGRTESRDCSFAK